MELGRILLAAKRTEELLALTIAPGIAVPQAFQRHEQDAWTFHSYTRGGLVGNMSYAPRDQEVVEEMQA
jgi:hypothetical protein